MKKVLNVFGIILSVLFTISLTIFIVAYIFLFIIKGTVSPKGLEKVVKTIDVATAIKENDAQEWKTMVEAAKEVGLEEQDLEEILNNESLKEEFSMYLNRILQSVYSGEEVIISQEELENTISIAIDEFNKVSDQKISEEEKQELINEIVNQEAVDDINESANSIRTTEAVPQEYSQVNKILFGNVSIYLLVIILVNIGLIALLRFSYYKWMPYVGTSGIISGIILLPMNALVSLIPLDQTSATIINPVIGVILSNIRLAMIVLFVISIALFIAHYFLKKMHNKPQEVN